MKHFLLGLSILTLTVVSQAEFQGEYVNNQAFYNATQFWEDKVNPDLDYFLNIDFTQHPEGQFLEAQKEVENYALRAPAKTKVQKISTQSMDDLLEIVFSYDEPFFCYTYTDLPENFGDYEKFGADCIDATSSFIAEALKSADAAYVVNAYGRDWGIFRVITLFLFDFENKESLRVEFDIIHEI